MRSILSILACFLIHNVCAQDTLNKSQVEDSTIWIQIEYDDDLIIHRNRINRNGIYARYYNTKTDLGLRIIEFDFSVKRNEDILYSYHNVGAYYNDKVKGIINDLKVGDIIFINNIKLIGTDDVQRYIPVAAYTIEKIPY